MIITRRKISTNWLALGLLIVLSVSVTAPVIKLWMPESVTCGMACCEASGVCYCQTHHTDDGKMTDAIVQADSHTVSPDEASIGQSCPTQCAQIPSSFQKHSIAKAATPRISIVISAIRQLFICTPHFAREALVAEAHSPRGPPVLIHS